MNEQEQLHRAQEEHREAFGEAGYTKGECKTLSEVWQVFKKHGLEATYCPHCNQFSQARVLQKQDAIISDLYEALKELLEDTDRTGYTSVPHLIKAAQALAKAEEK